MSVVLQLPQPYLLFLGDLTESGYGKTAYGLRDWAPERCIGEYALPEATATTGLPAAVPTLRRRLCLDHSLATTMTSANASSASLRACFH